MTKLEIKHHIEAATTNLLKNQPSFFAFTSETNQAEWNIAHHLANELQELFPGVDCDLDIIKPNLGRRRPDIVLHKRNSHKENLLVVEVKRDRDGIDDDLEKIREWWFGEPRLE